MAPEKGSSNWINIVEITDTNLTKLKSDKNTEA